MVESRERSGLQSKLVFYAEQVEVDSVAGKSSQASVYLGRDAETGVKVVVKQYQACNFRSMKCEVKILVLLEKARNKESSTNSALHQLLRRHQQEQDGLPDLLGFSGNVEFGEILMADAGKHLSDWKTKLRSRECRMSFALQMIEQVVKALERLHDSGYAHCDLKLENICCRVTRENKFKFTLIDLGVASSLPSSGDPVEARNFRGNLKFATAEQIVNKKADRIDDLFSVLYVAFEFARG